MRASLRRFALCGLMLAARSPFAQEPAHVHGAARLDVVVEGGGFSMRLYSPLDSLLGFEHAPRGAKQEEVARAMAATLRDPAKLFRANPEARCEPGKVDLSSPVLSAALLAGGGAPAARPAPASKDPGKKESHAGLDGSFEFACAQPGALRSLDATGMFAAFRRLGRIDVQLVTPRGQARRVLTRSSQSLSW